MAGVFITGTDTGVGKTLTSALIVSAFLQNKKKVKYFKPIQTGSDDDSETVVRLTGVCAVSNSYKYKQPISPDRAAHGVGEIISLYEIQNDFSQIKGFTVVEGAGGIMVPINDQQNMRDVAFAVNLPVIIVASSRLGTINHTLLTVQACRTKNLKVIGIVISGERDPGLNEVLEKWSDLPVLAHILPMKITAEEVKKLAPEIFSKNILDRIESFQ